MTNPPNNSEDMNKTRQFLTSQFEALKNEVDLQAFASEAIEDLKAEVILPDLLVGIAGVETPNHPDPYNAEGKEITHSSEHKKGDKAIGKYQIMPKYWKIWAKRILGDANAPTTPENQDKIAGTVLLEYYEEALKDGNSVADAIKIAAVKWYGNNGKDLKTVDDISAQKAPGRRKSPKQYAEDCSKIVFERIGIRSVLDKAIARLAEPSEDFDMTERELLTEFFTVLKTSLDVGDAQFMMESFAKLLEDHSKPIDHARIDEFFGSLQQELGISEVEPSHEELERIEKVADVGAPKLTDLLAHPQVVEKHPDLMKAAGEGSVDSIKSQVRSIIEAELAEWAYGNRQAIEKYKAGKQSKAVGEAYDKASGEVESTSQGVGIDQRTVQWGTEGLGDMVGVGEKVFEGDFSSFTEGMSRFPTGGILAIVFPPDQMELLRSALAEHGTGLFTPKGRNQGVKELGDKSVDELIDGAVDEVVPSTIDIAKLREIAGGLDTDPDALYQEIVEANGLRELTLKEGKDMKFLDRKMRTVGDEYLDTSWERLYKKYVLATGKMALDFYAWLPQSGISTWERITKLFQKVMLLFKDVFGDEEERTSEIRDELEVILGKPVKEYTRREKEGFERQRDNLLKIYNEDQNAPQKTMSISDIDSLEEWPHYKLENNLSALETIFAERGQDNILGVAAGKNLTIETLLEIYESQNDLWLNGENLSFKGSTDVIPWDDEAIADAIDARQESRLETNKNSLITLMESNTKILFSYGADFSKITFADILEHINDNNEFVADENDQNEEITQAYKKIWDLISHPDHIERFIILFSDLAYIEAKDSGEIEGEGALSYKTLDYIAQYPTDIRILLNDDPEINNNPHVGIIGSDSGDLKVKLDGLWVDFDNFNENLNELFRNEAFVNEIRRRMAEDSGEEYVPEHEDSNIRDIKNRRSKGDLDDVEKVRFWEDLEQEDGSTLFFWVGKDDEGNNITLKAKELFQKFAKNDDLSENERMVKDVVEAMNGPHRQIIYTFFSQLRESGADTVLKGSPIELSILQELNKISDIAIVKHKGKLKAILIREDGKNGEIVFADMAVFKTLLHNFVVQP